MLRNEPKPSNEFNAQDEYDRWSLTAKEKSQSMPTSGHVLLKQTHRKEMDDYVYSNEDIDKIVELNQKKKKVFSIAQRKQYLQHQLLVEEDEDKKREYVEELEELDKASEAQRLAMEDPITAGIVKLNQRSRYTGKSTTSTKKQKKDTDDPFSRRKTSATITTVTRVF